MDRKTKTINTETPPKWTVYRDLLAQKLKLLLPKLSYHRDIIILLLVGLLMIGFVDMLTVQKLQREQEYRETLMAQQLQAHLQSSLDEHVSALVTLNVIYQNFVDISHYDFQQYGQSITYNLKGFRRLFYLDPSLTIRRIYPLSPENSRLLGVTLKDNPQYLKVLQDARNSRSPTISPLLRFIDHPRTLLAFIPIYRNNSEFLGYAGGEISLEDIWEPLSHTDFLEKYQIQLVDSSGKSFFKDVPLKADSRNLTKLQFHVADKQWTLLLQPTQHSFEALIAQRMGIWSAGLLILFLMQMLIMASKRHKINLGEAQQKFETVFNSSPDGIVMLNDKLQLELTNPPIQSWLAASHNELSDKTFFDLFSCKCPHLNKCRELSYLLCTSEQFDEELPETLETQINNPTEGVPKTLRLNASRVQHNGLQKHNNGFICVLGDISTGKELERVKETYVATLTHDLKTPLVAQRLVLENILSGKAGEVSKDQRDMLNGAYDSVEDLLEMVQSTLVYYKLESATLVLNKNPHSIPVLIKEVIETLRPLVEKRKLTLELETALELPDLNVDSVQLKRVFHNLLSNAISYGKRGTPIRVSLQKEGEDRMLIEISNEGKGISAEDLPKVFEKYYSLSRKFKQIGTGLGLYISRRIVELHGGKIWAESEPDKVTRFFISLPCPQQV